MPLLTVTYSNLSRIHFGPTPLARFMFFLALNRVDKECICEGWVGSDGHCLSLTRVLKTESSNTIFSSIYTVVYEIRVFYILFTGSALLVHAQQPVVLLLFFANSSPLFVSVKMPWMGEWCKLRHWASFRLRVFSNLGFELF